MSRERLLKSYMHKVETLAPDEKEFHQAVSHVAKDVITIEKADTRYASARVLDRLAVPDRMTEFRVVWQNDAGELEINRGWRVQYCNALGPYKGGLRFHPSVSPSILKFLGFEQTFKNALTGLPLGGAKGGADFDPKGRSDAEIMRFCQAFMRALAPLIGPNRDVPAGDINVGTREIGWMFAAYKELAQAFEGALTGKGPSFGGSALRAEATGFGLVYFVQNMLAETSDQIEGQRVAVSGKGNVATHAALKAIELGANVITLSDTTGTLLAEDGLDRDTVNWVRERKAAGQDIAEPGKQGVRFLEGKTPWDQPCDVALPCATQNEIDSDMAGQLADNGVRLVAEGANMPLTDQAGKRLEDAGIPHAPGKASNAGGVAISGLEMSQNAHGQYLSPGEVDAQLQAIMRRIHDRVVEEGRTGNRIDYSRGANISAFRPIADAITATGAI